MDPRGGSIRDDVAAILVGSISILVSANPRGSGLIRNFLHGGLSDSRSGGGSRGSRRRLVDDSSGCTLRWGGRSRFRVV